MALTLTQPVKTSATVEQMKLALPPLENGDHLSRAEFEQRYEAMPQVKKAELIERKVYMSSPVRINHAESHSAFMAWLGTYWVEMPGLQLLDNATVRLDSDNVVQPDALLRLPETQGGQSHPGEDGYLDGPPELVIEIAGSSAAYDFHEKWQVYRRCGVQEYLLWRLYEQRIDWFYLSEGQYQPLTPLKPADDVESDAGEAQIFESRIFPGLRLNLTAALTGDLPNVMHTLRAGLNSSAGQAFKQKLTHAKTD